LEDRYITFVKRGLNAGFVWPNTQTHTTQTGGLDRFACLFKVPIILLLMFLTKKVVFWLYFTLTTVFLDLLLHYSWLEMVKTVVFVEETACDTASVKNLHMNPTFVGYF